MTQLGNKKPSAHNMNGEVLVTKHAIEPLKLFVKHPPGTPRQTIPRIPVALSTESSGSSYNKPYPHISDIKTYHDFVMQSLEKLQNQISNSQNSDVKSSDVKNTKNEIEMFYKNLKQTAKRRYPQCKLLCRS